MQSTGIHLTVLSLYMLYSVDGKLFECSDSDPSGVVARVLKKDSKALPYQKKLEELFTAFDNVDAQRIEEVYTFFKTVRIDDVEEFTQYPIKSVPDRIKSEGYPVEIHQVVTNDGYKLRLHRIPYGIKSPQTDKPRPPVLLMHGFLDSSNGWIVLGPENSLAYLLADNGYDVWLGNARGTEPSRRHTHFSPNGIRQDKYWAFSWHEIGVHDLSSFIDYILNETKFEKLNYVGFSQGTTSFFVLTSMRPEYNDKIIEASLLAPVALMQGNNALANAIAHYYKPLKKLFEILRIYKLTVNNQLITKISEIACSKIVQSTTFACKLVLSVLTSNQINCTSLPHILINTPSGVSLRQGIHYIQLTRDGGFRQFDYEDKKINQQIYGSNTPPDYNLTQITVPVNLFYSKDDTTASFENVVQLKSMLSNIKSAYLVPVADFKHVDFVYSRYVRKALNDRIVNTINKAN